MPTEERIPIGDGDIPIALFHPEATKAPALVVMPSIFGLADDLRDGMRALADGGALVAGLDPFHRVKPGAIPYEDLEAAFARMKMVKMQNVVLDLTAVCDWLRRHPACNGKVIGLGICFGGPFCFMAAAAGRLDGVVTWHGSRLHEFVDRADRIRCPLSLHFGDSDAFVPMDKVEQIQAAFAGRDDVEIVVHAGADHGFSHAGNAHHPKAAAASLRSLEQMIDRVR